MSNEFIRKFGEYLKSDIPEDMCPINEFTSSQEYQEIKKAALDQLYVAICDNKKILRKFWMRDSSFCTLFHLAQQNVSKYNMIINSIESQWKIEDDAIKYLDDIAWITEMRDKGTVLDIVGEVIKEGGVKMVNDYDDIIGVDQKTRTQLKKISEVLELVGDNEDNIVEYLLSLLAQDGQEKYDDYDFFRQILHVGELNYDILTVAELIALRIDMKDEKGLNDIVNSLLKNGKLDYFKKLKTVLVSILGEVQYKNILSDISKIKQK